MRLTHATLLPLALLAASVSHDAWAKPHARPPASTKPHPVVKPQNDKRSNDNRVAQAFSITVGGITANKRIPPRYTYCTSNGTGGTMASNNVSPAIQWTEPPPGTKSFVLLMVDKDVPQNLEKINRPNETIETGEPRQDFYHWIIADIPVSVKGILEGVDSNGITPGGKPYGAKYYGIVGQNDYVLFSQGQHGGYDGPCPPWNDKRRHFYHITIYALDIPSLRLPNPIRGRQVEISIRGHILAQSEFVAPFTTSPFWRRNAR